jgi:membrane-associated protein
MSYLHALAALPPGPAYLAVFLILAAESGLLIGFFLPGDTLIFPLGLLASQGILSFPVLLIACIAGAVTGDTLGYFIGKAMGPRLFKKNDSIFFKAEYVERAQAFFERYGRMTLIMARFTPIVRTLAPTIAGVGRMDYRTFFVYNAVGGILWSAVLLSLGYFLGRVVPNVDHYLLPLVAVILVVSLVGPVRHFLQHRGSGHG